MTPVTLIFVLAGIWLFLVLIMILAIYLECKRKVKQIDHAHKMESTTISEPDNIPWRDLGMEYDEYPYVKLL